MQYSNSTPSIRMASLRDCTVLLVDPSTLPPRLEAVLSARGAFAESTDPDRLAGTLIVSSPDVIVTSDRHHEAVCRAIRSVAEEQKIPVVLIGKAGDASSRTFGSDGVAGVISPDMPASAVAVRIQTILTKLQSLRGPLPNQPSGRLAPEPARTETRSASKIVVPTKVLQRLPQEKPAKRDPWADTNPRDQECITSARGGGPPDATNRTSRSRGGNPRMSAPSPSVVARPTVAAMVPLLPDRGGWIPAVLGGPAVAPSPESAEKAADPGSAPSELPSITSLPAERVSLETVAGAITATRIALLDEDVGRADALARALRQAGHDVFLLSRASGANRWKLLRKFAPQGLVQDELGPAQDGGAWLTALRSDPFLRDVPLIAIPLANLFDEANDTVNLAPLSPRLEGLNKIEHALLGQLSAGREIAIGRRQLNAAQLLSLLSHHEKSANLQFRDGALTLSWHIARGQAGAAQLQAEGACRDLPQDDALRWLLDRPDAQIVVRQCEAVSTGAHTDIMVLLEEAYDQRLPAFPAPSAPLHTVPLRKVRSDPVASCETENHRASAPDFVASAIAPPIHRQAEESPCDPSSTIQSTTPPAIFNQVSPAAQLTSNMPRGMATPTEPNHDEEANRESAKWATVTGLVQVLESLDARRRKWTLPRRRVQMGLATAAVLGLLGTIAAAWSRAPGSVPTSVAAATEEVIGNQVEPVGAEAMGAAPTQNPSAQPERSAAAAPQKPLDSAVARPEFFFRVKSDTAVKSCDAVLGEPKSHFTSKPRWQGKAVWKQARHQLLIGQEEAAHRLMCQAALIDPLGRASVGLGDFYLSRRALEQAHAWATYGIKHRADFARSDKELLGDILCQMGDVQNAKTEWLQTMKVEANDLSKLQAVSRSLTASAGQARRGGDYPLVERLLRRAVVFDEENSEAAAQLSESLFKNGQIELAERWAQRALGMDPAAGYALLTAGDLAAVKGEKEQSRNYYARISKDSTAAHKAKERLTSL